MDAGPAYNTEMTGNLALARTPRVICNKRENILA